MHRHTPVEPTPSPPPRLLRGFLRFLASCFADSQNASIRPLLLPFHPAASHCALPFSLQPARGIRGSLIPLALSPVAAKYFVSFYCVATQSYLSLALLPALRMLVILLPFVSFTHSLAKNTLTTGL